MIGRAGGGGESGRGQARGFNRFERERQVPGVVGRGWVGRQAHGGGGCCGWRWGGGGRTEVSVHAGTQWGVEGRPVPCRCPPQLR